MNRFHEAEDSTQEMGLAYERREYMNRVYSGCILLQAHPAFEVRSRLNRAFTWWCGVATAAGCQRRRCLERHLQMRSRQSQQQLQALLRAAFEALKAAAVEALEACASVVLPFSEPATIRLWLHIG